MDINHISVSRKKCYDTCAQQYKYRYHLKIPRPGPEPFYFIYGKIIHKIAEVHVESKGEKPIGEIAKEVLRGQIEIEPNVKAPSLPTEYQRKFPKHLRALANLTGKIGTEGIVEYKFHWDLDNPNEKFATGFIDRLIIKGDKAFIIDYKTTKKGKWRVNPSTVKHDLQLKVYSRVVQKDFGLKAKNIKAALYYLEGEELVACQYSEEALERVEQELRESYINIENTNPNLVRGTVGRHCNNCDYKEICPFLKSSQNADGWDGNTTNLGLSGW